MNKLKVAIVDDEKDARDTLTGLLDLYCENVEVIGEADSIDTATKLVNQAQPDLVFLDIRLGEEHGFDLLKNTSNPDFKIIFVTGDENFAIDAFRVNAIDYLLKPLIPEDLEAAVNKVVKLKEKGNITAHLQNLAAALPPQTDEKILIPTNTGMHLVDTDKIIHIKGEGGYSTFHREAEGQITVAKNLTHYEKLLSATQFFRAHQSHLVNLNFIKTILPAEDCICLKNDVKIPLSRAKKKELTELLRGRFRS